MCSSIKFQFSIWIISRDEFLKKESDIASLLNYRILYRFEFYISVIRFYHKIMKYHILQRELL